MGNLPQPPQSAKQCRQFLVEPKYWVEREEVEKRLAGWDRQWLVGFRDITAAMVERTGIFAIVPRCAVGNTTTLLFPGKGFVGPWTCCLLANLNSLVADYFIRTKLTYVHLSQFVLKQIAIVHPAAYKLEDHQFIVPRTLGLVDTADDIHSFGDDVWCASDSGIRAAITELIDSTGLSPDSRPVFRWKESSRGHHRAELDAYYAHLYGLTRGELRYILDPKDVFGEDFPSETFRVLKEREIKEYGEYRTRRLVLAAWDAAAGGAVGPAQKADAAR